MDDWCQIHNNNNNLDDLQQDDGIGMANKTAFVQPSSQFGQAGLTDGNIMIDPMLQSMAPADASVYSAIPGSVAGETYMSNTISNPGHIAMYNGGEMYLSMPGIGNGDMDYREPSDPATSSNVTSQTRSISPSSEGHYRKASAASSRSSIPSLATLPEKKTRTSKQRSTRQTTKEPAASAQKRQSKQKAQMPKQEPIDDFGLEDDTKRNRFLERNRIAASKCRKKKKEWVNDLEETKLDLETQNANLHSEYNGLVNELSRIKTELMNHASCNDANIDSWLDLEARKFVQKAAKQQLQTQAVGMQQRHARAYSDAGSSINISPTTSTVPLPLSPKSQDNTEFNYDHMPDDMFDQ